MKSRTGGLSSLCGMSDAMFGVKEGCEDWFAELVPVSRGRRFGHMVWRLSGQVFSTHCHRLPADVIKSHILAARAGK
jgi:hypothetical protein